MGHGANVEHSYPDAFALWHHLGPDAVAVLHALLTRAREDDRGLVATASTRGIATDLGYLSKDRVHRSLRALRAAELIAVLPAEPVAFAAPTYGLQLAGSGVTVSGLRTGSSSTAS